MQMTRHSAVSNCANAIHRPFRELALPHVRRSERGHHRGEEMPTFIFCRVKNTTAANTSYFSRKILSKYPMFVEREKKLSFYRMFPTRASLTQCSTESPTLSPSRTSSAERNARGLSTIRFIMFEDGNSLAHPSGGFPQPVNPSRVYA